MILKFRSEFQGLYLYYYILVRSHGYKHTMKFTPQHFKIILTKIIFFFDPESYKVSIYDYPSEGVFGRWGGGKGTFRPPELLVRLVIET